MRLKDLVMQTTYEKIEPALKKKYDSKGLVYDDQKKMKLKKVFDTLYNMEPEHECEMKLAVAPCDVSGYYDEETLKKDQEYHEGMYSLTATPWSFWLGMEVDEDTLKDMSVEDIMVNCIYEMTWWGYDEETINLNINKFIKGHDSNTR